MPPSKDILRIVMEAAEVISGFSNPLADLVSKNTEDVIEKTKNISDKTIEEIQKEATKQEIILHMNEVQARVAQELAIARRIDTAEEVEIEEFYDTSGDGTLGVKTDGATFSAGLGGSGKRVSKRIYRFKGWRDGGLFEMFEQQLKEENQIKEEE